MSDIGKKHLFQKNESSFRVSVSKQKTRTTKFFCFLSINITYLLLAVVEQFGGDTECVPFPILEPVLFGRLVFLMPIHDQFAGVGKVVLMGEEISGSFILQKVNVLISRAAALTVCILKEQINWSLKTNLKYSIASTG